MGHERYEKQATQNTHVSAETKQTKIRVFGNGIMHVRTSLRTHEFSLRAQARSCVRRSLPKKPNLHKNKAESKQNMKHKI